MIISGVAAGLALAALSAGTSALTHAYLKSGEDRLAIRAWACLVCAAAALPVAIWTGPLPRAFWGLLAVFAVISAINQLILIRSYRLNDFSLAYPVARGVVPITMTVLGWLFLGDRLVPLALGGVAATTLGILSLALGRGMTRHGWGAALLVGLTTIVYTLLTAKGMRASHGPANFLAWLFVADGLIVPVFLFTQSRGNSAARLRSNFRIGLLTGASSLMSFSALAFAMRFAPAGAVSAIRETSVLIALLLAAVMLKEKLDARRIAAGLLIMAGGMMIVAGQ